MGSIFEGILTAPGSWGAGLVAPVLTDKDDGMRGKRHDGGGAKTANGLTLPRAGGTEALLWRKSQETQSGSDSTLRGLR